MTRLDEIRLSQAARQARWLPRTLRLVWQAAPGWTTGWAAMLIVQGLLPVAVVYLTRAVVDSLVAAMGSGGEGGTLRPALTWIALMAGVLLLREVLRVVAGYVRAAQSEHVQDHIHDRIHRHSAEADLAFYETPEFYDHLHRARFEARHRPLELLENLGRLVQDGITLVAMAVVLVAYAWWLPLALLVSTAPALWIVIRH
ncbi:MAG TPA: ABC transporter ATP-binding protein, partial [Gemmatimonadota bacterium]|nr:ABC transporter ATP-binding protein [Gemmatimonadota bacterium]